jgi:hypothetical protein
MTLMISLTRETLMARALSSLYRRLLAALLVAALSLGIRPAFADEAIPNVECAIGKSVQGLTATEQEEIRMSNGTLDPVVSEYLLRWGPPAAPRKPPNTNNSIGIEWTQAKRMIYMGLVATVVQTHALDVWLISTSGKSYKAREPSLDEVFRSASVVDPCHRYIEFLTE